MYSFHDLIMTSHSSAFSGRGNMPASPGIRKTRQRHISHSWCLSTPAPGSWPMSMGSQLKEPGQPTSLHFLPSPPPKVTVGGGGPLWKMVGGGSKRNQAGGAALLGKAVHLQVKTLPSSYPCMFVGECT